MSFLESFKFDHEVIFNGINNLVDSFDRELAFLTPSPDMNHAAWLIGHITWVEDYLIVEVPTGKSFRNKQWDGLFGDSSPKLTKEDLPSINEIIDHYQSTHQQVTSYLNTLNDKDLEKAAVVSHFFKTTISSLVHFIEEGSYHHGQLQYLAKFLKLHQQSSTSN